MPEPVSAHYRIAIWSAEESFLVDWWLPVYVTNGMRGEVPVPGEGGKFRILEGTVRAIYRRFEGSS